MENNLNKKYIVYLTKNLVNNKIYVGVHGTENPDIFDGYYGDGINIKDLSKLKHPLVPFHYALKKYGFKNFNRSTIKVFDNLLEALNLEAEIVNEEFIKRKDTYNITLGGGMPPIKTIRTYQFSLDGKLLNEYESILAAAKTVGVDDSAIGYAIANKTTSAEYLWAITDTINIKEYTQTVQRKEVYLYDIDGNYIMSYPSISECARQLNVTFAPVQRAYLIGGKVKGYYIYHKKLSCFIPDKIRLTGKVHQYNLDGSYITTFDTIKDVEKHFKVSMLGINLSIKMQKPYKDFLWWRGDKLESVKPYKLKPKTRKVGQYDKDGNLIKVFDTVRAARLEFANVNKCLKGTAQYCKGFAFKYIND